jgi:hypothetical protein
MTNLQQLQQALTDVQAAKELLDQVKENPAQRVPQDALRKAESALIFINNVINKTQVRHGR